MLERRSKLANNCGGISRTKLRVRARLTRFDAADLIRSVDNAATLLYSMCRYARDGRRERADVGIKRILLSCRDNHFSFVKPSKADSSI